MKYIAYIALVFWWMAGIVLAKGFWLTALAIALPFYAWYLVVERLMQIAGIM